MDAKPTLAPPQDTGHVESSVKDDKPVNIWKDILGSPRYVVAPMVDASELAWRILCRRHGAQLCYTPMLHSAIFARDAGYRRVALASVPEDRPLIVQFCSNNADTLLEAARLASPHCDGVDINLGCPQAIARRGHYGAFLQDDWDLLHEMVSKLRANLTIPVTCKIRVFPEKEKTVKYAQMLEQAGCQLLTVHGRTREQKGPLTGLASWDHIKAVVENVSIPVFANGNIQCVQDVERCITETGVCGVMTAEGNLSNPALFKNVSPPCWELTLEYLDLVKQYPCPLSYSRTHLFKLLHHLFSLPENAREREELAKGQNLEDFRSLVERLRDRYLPYHEGHQTWNGSTNDNYDLILPPWICQPYVRIPPEEHLKKLAKRQAEIEQESLEKSDEQRGVKRVHDVADDGYLSKRQRRKLARGQIPQTPAHRRAVEKCTECPNPLGTKCGFRLCKQCCRTACFNLKRDCPGHKILTKTRYERLLHFQALEKKQAEASTSENSAAEEPAPENSAAEEPAPENSAAEEPAPEKFAAEEPAPEKFAAEEPAPENSAAEKPPLENSTVEESAPEDACQD